MSNHEIKQDQDGDLYLMTVGDEGDLIECRSLGAPSESLYEQTPPEVHASLATFLEAWDGEYNEWEEYRVTVEHAYPYGDIRRM